MQQVQFERLESRLQFNSINYGVCASGDPSVTGVLAESGPGLKDLGAQGVRLFTNTSYLSSDFDLTASGKIYVRNEALARSLNYSKQYHDAGIKVTLCLQLSIDRSMYDGSLLTDPATGKARKMLPSELRSPKVFRTWFETLAKAQISKTDRTSVTKVLDFWEIGNETNHSRYWPVDATQPDPDLRIKGMIDSYVDHNLAPAYSVLHALGEPVIAAGIGGSSAAQYDFLNNQPGARKHQFSNNCDYLNVHPYGVLNSPVPSLTPAGQMSAFTTSIYGDGTVKKPFVATEYNLSDLGHDYALDPSPNPRDAADQFATAKDLDASHAKMLTLPHVAQRCSWFYYYRAIADAAKQRGAIFYPASDGNTTYTPLRPLYDMFKSWTTTPASSAKPAAASGIQTLDANSVVNAIAIQKDGKTLVASDDGVRRYDAAGKLDKTYALNGFAALSVLPRAIALQGDGNLIIAGSQMDLTSQHLAVIRLSAAGKIDRSFGNRGYFATPNGSSSQARSVVLRAGKILVAGKSKGIRDGVLIRLGLDGQYDTSFAGNGLNTLRGIGTLNDLTIAKNGSMAATLNVYGLTPQTAVVRFTTNGELDATFSADGISDLQPVFGDGLFLESNGSVSLVGHTQFAERPVVTRFTPTGALDKTFGVNGVQKIGGKKVIRGNTLQLADGSRYLYGSIASSLTSDTKRIFVSRLTSDLQIDPTFGSGGVLTLASKGVQDVPFAATIGPSGKPVIAAGVFAQSGNGKLWQELVAVPLA